MAEKGLKSKQSDSKACAFNHSTKLPPSKEDGTTDGTSYTQIQSSVFISPQSSYTPEILREPRDPKVCLV